MAQVEPRIFPGNVNSLPDKPAIVGPSDNLGDFNLSESPGLERQSKD